MPDRVIRIKNEVAEIARLSREVAGLLRAQGVAEAFIRTVNLGVEEVVTNIIKYAYDDEREHWIEVTLGLTMSEVQIVVLDEGREFDPLQHPEPDRTKPLDDREPGGLGVSFYRHLFDEVQYQRAAGKNSLAMRKRLPHARPQ